LFRRRWNLNEERGDRHFGLAPTEEPKLPGSIEWQVTFCVILILLYEGSL
jgi:hypothetical protein